VNLHKKHLVLTYPFVRISQQVNPQNLLGVSLFAVFGILSGARL